LEEALMPWYYGYSQTITEIMLNSRISFYASGVSSSATISEIMLNKGPTAKPYTPYQRNTLPIPAEVQALEGYGDGVNESLYNYIDYEKKQFVKRIGVVDIGTLDWTGFGVYFAHTGQIFKPSANVISALPSPFDTIRVDIYGALVVTFSEDYGFTSADDVESAMSGVMLYYELAEPIVTDISDILPADNLIAVEGGGTITMVNEHEYAVPSEIIYQVKGVSV
jgi:hypothetical protein